MKKVFFVSIHPDFIKAYFRFGVFKKALQQGQCEFEVVSLRDFAVDQHGTVDGHPYGGGAGMILRPEPLSHCLDNLKLKHLDLTCVMTSPRGEQWTQAKANAYCQSEGTFVFVCGRFEGIDQRLSLIHI